MLKESLVETRRMRLEGRRAALLPVVIILHAAFIGTLVISSLWSIEYITEPPVQVTLFAPPPPPPPPPARRRPQASPRRQPQRPRPRPVTTSAEVAPLVIPEYTPEILPPEEFVVEDIGEGVEGGIEWGVEGGGVEGGVPGGIPGGVPGGIPGTGPVRVETIGGEPPRIISRFPCIYPEAARRLRIEGVVILEAVILKDGRLGSIKVLRSLNELLDQAAIDCIRQYKYEPGKINGRPVDSYMTLTVRFVLQGG